ncbi:translation initiation factor 2C-like protein, partial [Leptotrombidium deliense]
FVIKMAKGKRDRRKKQKETSEAVQEEPNVAVVQPTASTSGSQSSTVAGAAVTTATEKKVQSTNIPEHEVQPVATTSKISAIVTPGAEDKALVQKVKELTVEPSKPASDPKKSDKKKVETEIVASFKPESKVDLPFVKRPGYGKLGQKVQLIVNYYRLRVRRLTIYHYDVVVEQLTTNAEAGDAPKLIRSRQISARNINHSVVKQMCDTYSGVKEVFHGKLPVFDGQKNLYSAKELLLPKEGRFLVKHNDGGRECEFAVTLKYAGHVDYNPDRHIDASDKMTQVLEIMLAYGPRFAKQNPKLVIRSSLYDTKAEAVDLGENKLLRFGCYGNVKHTKEGLMFNLDRKAAVFHKGGMLLAVIQQLGVSLRPPYQMSKRERDLIDGQLKHLKITVIHMNYERKYTYQKLTEKSASDITFMHDGKKVSVKNYFEQTYKDSLRRLRITLNGNLPCVNVGKEKYLPLEVCKLVPDQQFSGKLPEHILGQMTRQSSQMKPAERFAKINQYRNELAADGRDYMAQMGIEIDVQMVTVDGRVLPMPKLVNKDATRQSATAFVPQKMGSWKMDGPAKHFFHTVPCAKWLMFNFAHPNITRDSVDSEQCKSFVLDFRRIAAKLGMQFAMPAEVPPLLNPKEFVGQIGERLFTRALGKYP